MFIKASSRREPGFYRAGKYWPSGGAVHELTDDEALQVTKEPMLIVSGFAATREELEGREREQQSLQAQLQKQIEERQAAEAKRVEEQAKQLEAKVSGKPAPAPTPPSEERKPEERARR